MEGAARAAREALILAAALAAGAGAGPALARAGGAAHDQLVGAGLYTVPQPYEGVGTSLVPVPLANLSYGRFYVYGTEGGFRWNERSLLGWRLFVSPRFMGYDSGESPALDGMAPREFSGDAGAGITLRPIPFLIDLDFRTDILGRNDGEEVNLDVDVLVPAAGWLLRPSAGMQWQSASMTGYYYGVTDGESRPGRRAYDPGSTINWFIELEASRSLGDRWTFVAGVTSLRFGGEVSDSPIVDASHTETGYVGALFGF